MQKNEELQQFENLELMILGRVGYPRMFNSILVPDCLYPYLSEYFIHSTRTQIHQTEFIFSFPDLTVSDGSSNFAHPY